ncbi:hypothetical protein ElyMa_003862100 [Elysia marginata]|uniref:G-protein coupled receptors family 1 profile domain-containing protein n=1 Tax=Elysia marginata TaxID=1093978 RepID=A0AAV4FIH6_9GAST|nr:hypothetical protein ElyMa_003862100 [Elysia marginata]
MGLVFVNLLNNAQCMALDVSLAAGIYIGWPVCFTQFLNAPFCIYATLMLVTVINFERVVAIKWPIFYRTHFTRNMAVLVTVCVLTFAMGLSLIGLPDILHQYEQSDGICLPTDLYPKRYALILISITCSVLLIIALASFMSNVLVLVKFSQQKLVRAVDNPSVGAQKLSRRALVGSRIAIASAFLYTWTMGYLVFFLFWILITDCDDMCLVEGKSSFIAAILQNVFTIQDPLVYFISIIKWSSLKHHVVRLSGAKQNQVAPYTPYPHGSSDSQTRIYNIHSQTTSSQRQFPALSVPLQAREAVI